MKRRFLRPWGPFMWQWLFSTLLHIAYLRFLFVRTEFLFAISPFSFFFFPLSKYHRCFHLGDKPRIPWVQAFSISTGNVPEFKSCEIFLKRLLWETFNSNLQRRNGGTLRKQLLLHGAGNPEIFMKWKFNYTRLTFFSIINLGFHYIFLHVYIRPCILI